MSEKEVQENVKEEKEIFLEIFLMEMLTNSLIIILLCAVVMLISIILDIETTAIEWLLSLRTLIPLIISLIIASLMGTVKVYSKGE